MFEPASCSNGSTGLVSKTRRKMNFHCIALMMSIPSTLKSNHTRGFHLGIKSAGCHCRFKKKNAADFGTRSSPTIRNKASRRKADASFGESDQSLLTRTDIIESADGQS